MTALCIAAAAMLFLAWIPFVVRLYYDEYGFAAVLCVLCFRIPLVPSKNNAGKKAKPKTESKSVKKKNRQRKPAFRLSELGGKLPAFRRILQIGAQTVRRLPKCLSLRILACEVQYGGSDPAQTAVRYGAACGAAYAMMPLLSHFVAFRPEDISICYVPSSDDIRILFSGRVRIFLWQVFYLSMPALWKILLLFIQNKKETIKGANAQ